MTSWDPTLERRRLRNSWTRMFGRKIDWSFSMTPMQAQQPMSAWSLTRLSSLPTLEIPDVWLAAEEGQSLLATTTNPLMNQRELESRGLEGLWLGREWMGFWGLPVLLVIFPSRKMETQESRQSVQPPTWFTVVVRVWTSSCWAATVFGPVSQTNKWLTG